MRDWMCNERRAYRGEGFGDCEPDYDPYEDMTEEEIAEQKALRTEYIAEFRASFTGILENTVIQYPDGSRQSLPDMRDAKKNEKK